ncbi:MAG: DNA mismatch repair endonuclease MutL [Nanoarchaeota archaeon]|nr:DNA mismatch repair endonuclease MutL [Nanoarchaeota archaeon]MBU1631688.1 DNA mismatch repair endonuclease MutL [Nanoarchaeota archaeon]MBU1876250.1 DNA mismatch repair endonuclease MutL [Nanoarchaeota archaeon]
MSKITVLDEDLINKIAAGEVIERPASVVKELIENSLDANSTKIIIEIKDSGKKLIKISDNGEGMSEDDAKKSILRHATSKISSLDDLFSIKTLGFRGEALASIAAVSQLSITTKQKEGVGGFNLVVEGGNVVSSGIIAAEQGTTIEVHNLFFNTPVRKKFLKTDTVELRHIIDVVTQYALANPEVYFKLIHENHSLINSPAVEDPRNNIAAIYGITIAKDLLEVRYGGNKKFNERDNELDKEQDHEQDYESSSINITGFVAKPHQARNDKNQQVIFVNGRWVKNNDITKAVYDAFHSLLFVNKHPIFVLNLELDPEKIDVNVHPQKYEIKIEQKEKVIKAVFTAVKETLENNNLIPIVDFDFEQQLTFGTPKKKDVPKPEVKYRFEKSQQSVFAVREESEQLKKEDGQLKDDEQFHEKSFVSEQSQTEEIPESVKLPPMKILGQIHKTFFVAETPGGVLFIDQHVVQERVLYEKFMNELMGKKVSTQTLLQEEIIDFTPVQRIVVEENKEILEKLGFKLEHFGENTFVLKTIPSLFGRLQSTELIHEMIDYFDNGKNERKTRLEEIQEEIITRMACRASVKAGDDMTLPEIQKLLAELSDCKLPYTCPHGRAILIKVDVNELEKKFKRK